MYRALAHRPSPAMVMASIALFVSSGGSAYAALNLPANSVGTTQLTNGAVTGAKLHNNAVTSTKVKDHSLLARDFKAGQLPAGPQGPPGRASGAAGGDLTGSYPGPSIAPGAVTTSKFAPGAEAPNAAELDGLSSSAFGAPNPAWVASNDASTALGSSATTLVSVTVPAGHYVFQATVNVASATNSPAACSLSTGDSVTGNPSGGTTLTLMDFRVMTSGSNITLDCTGVSTEASSPRLAAIKVDSLQ